MALQGQLSEERKLFVENDGDQTHISLQSGSSGQQQSQGSSFTTGAWQQEPVLYKTPHGPVLQVEGAKGRVCFQIHGNSIHILDETPNVYDAETIPLHEAEAPHIKPMAPMKPMQPMKPMAPMEMKMGDMHLKMGGESSGENSGEAPETGARFCTQCGARVEAGDKFCGKCGRKLRD